MSVWIFLPDTLFDEVIPAKNLFGPKLKRIQQFQITAICQGQFIFTKRDETINGLIIVVNSWIRYQTIDAVHFHRNVSTDRDLTS